LRVHVKAACIAAGHHVTIASFRRSLAALAASALLAAASPACAFDVEGHRGARGLAPENTLAAFRKALSLGVTTLETDLHVTRDGVLVISHNPRPSPDLTRDAAGEFLAHEGPRIHDLTLAELRAYDIGRINPASKYAQQFPRQQPSDGERMPTLAELFDLVKASGPGVRLNLETKLTPDEPANTPPADAFARLVVDAVHGAGLDDRVTIQSFDWRTLFAVKRVAPSLRTACLTIETPNSDNVQPRDGKPSPWTAGLDLHAEGDSVPRLAKAAQCDVWSPFWRNATPARIAEAHALGLQVLPWTVNDPSQMRALVDAGVDGLITDYPDRLLELVRPR
jgi:glycerophosphoryl diester phosphodiesterase